MSVSPPTNSPSKSEIPTPISPLNSGLEFRELHSPFLPTLTLNLNSTASRGPFDISAAERKRRHLNARLANPLDGYTFTALKRMGRAYAYEHALAEPEDVRAMELGACLAQKPRHTDTLMGGQVGLTQEEIEVLKREKEKSWSQPWTLYLVVALCSTCAAVQGMDETVVNGAQIFYSEQFGIAGNSPRSTWLGGLTNGAPYMCCALLGCWMTTPFNDWLGRRGTIFITCLLSAIACFWQGFVNTWWHMFIARFFLGFGIGPKSATVPIYAAECAPPAIRGALVMQWQVWTAFGIMLGLISDLIFYSVKDTPSIHGLNWRLMMASAMLPAVAVCSFVFLCPESPRWYLSQGRHSAAYRTLCRLRENKVMAARDLFYMSECLRVESADRMGQSRIRELFTVGRNRRAMVASEVVMFMQQFCGINVIAYYSSTIFRESGFSDQHALAASLGFGVINFLFATPAIYLIDTHGRRPLLLTTLPLMSLALLFTSLSFYIPSASTHSASHLYQVSDSSNNATSATAESHGSARLACIALGIYMFGMLYSPGCGPVPFTYSAEAYPLYARALGMSLATATTWFFNFVRSITWLSLKARLRPQGAFAFYAAWNWVGWWAVLLLLPETKGKTLEELDQVFGVPTGVLMGFGLKELRWFFRKCVFRKKAEPDRLFAERHEGQGDGERLELV